MVGAVYLDASALVKLILNEVESRALEQEIASAGARMTSRVAQVEVHRAVKRVEPAGMQRVRELFESLLVAELDGELAEEAASLEPASLRSLDAIHIASALRLGEELEAFITYDTRQATAAMALGLRVVAPA